jgi:DNA polymerase alpha subunit A
MDESNEEPSSDIIERDSDIDDSYISSESEQTLQQTPNEIVTTTTTMPEILLDIPPCNDITEKQSPITQTIEFMDGQQLLKTERSKRDKDRSTTIEQVLPENGDFILFYWIESAASKNPNNSVILFGKFKTTKSDSLIDGCIRLPKIKKVMYAALRKKNVNGEEDTEEEVIKMYERAVVELRERFSAHANAINLRDRDIEFSLKRRNYAFGIIDLEAGRESMPSGNLYFVKIRTYEWNGTRKMKEWSGEYYSRIFETESKQIECVMRKLGLKGPEWVAVDRTCATAITTERTTYSDLELSIGKIDGIKMLDTSSSIKLGDPGKRIASIALVTSAGHFSSLISITLSLSSGYERYKNNVDFTLINNDTAPKNKRQLVTTANDNQHISERIHYQISYSNERSLILGFSEAIYCFDPDIIIGHKLMSHMVPALCTAIKKANNQNCSTIGRVINHNMVNDLLNGVGRETGPYVCRNLFSGRIPCDTFKGANDYMPNHVSYELPALSKIALKTEISVDINNAESFLEAGVLYSTMAHKLCEHISLIDLTIETSRLTGCSPGECLCYGNKDKAERTLSYAFGNLNYVLPDDVTRSNTESSVKKGPKYKGGLVLTPKKGLYNETLTALIDFKSLYPSLIQEHNVCFSTAIFTNVGENKYRADPPDASERLGVIPTVIKNLVRARRKVRESMRGVSEKSTLAKLNIKQLALKLMSNVIYGCLGLPSCKYGSVCLAELITRSGRENLIASVNLVTEKLGGNVIYGDTDSLMISTRSKTKEEALVEIKVIIDEINAGKRFIEIDFADVFSRILLLSKKKYAAISIMNDKKPTEIIKGLDMIRREWCEFSRRCCRITLDALFGNEIDRNIVIKDVIEKVKSQCDSLEENKVAVGDLTITKVLSKEISEYGDPSRFEHVQAAYDLFTKTGQKMGSGESISYIHCLSFDGESRFVPIQIYDTEKEEVTIDKDYYVKKQVFSAVSRLLKPVSESVMTQLSEALRISGRKCVRRRVRKERREYGEDEDEDITLNELDDSHKKTSTSVTQNENAANRCFALKISCDRVECVQSIPVSMDAEQHHGGEETGAKPTIIISTTTTATTTEIEKTRKRKISETENESTTLSDITNKPGSCTTDASQKVTIISGISDILEYTNTTSKSGFKCRTCGNQFSLELIRKSTEDMLAAYQLHFESGNKELVCKNPTCRRIAFDKDDKYQKSVTNTSQNSTKNLRICQVSNCMDKVAPRITMHDYANHLCRMLWSFDLEYAARLQRSMFL